MNLNDSRSYLHIKTSARIEGQNFKEIRADWFDISAFKLDDTFVLNGATVKGAWIQDSGDQAAPFETREKRAFCVKGKASATFSGTSISVRASLNPGWGRAKVLIDGQLPSTIPGLTQFSDYVTCDSDIYGSWGNEFKDEMIADNLPPGNHTLELICSDNSANAFFIFSGFKTYSYNNKSLDIDTWALATNERDQISKMTVSMPPGMTALNVLMEFDGRMLDPDSNRVLGPRLIDVMTSSNPFEADFKPTLLGTEPSGIIPMPVHFSCLLPDPTGANFIDTPVALDSEGTSITKVGDWWYDPPAPPTNEGLAGADKLNSFFTFLHAGDSFKIRTMVTYGGPGINIYKDVKTYSVPASRLATTITIPGVTGVIAGMTVLGNGVPAATTVVSVAGNVVTISKALTANGTRTFGFGTLHTVLSTHEENEVAQDTFVNKTVAGFTNDYVGLIMCSPATNNQAISWNTIFTVVRGRYSQMSEDIVFNLNMIQVGPAPIKNVRLSGGVIKYDDPNFFDHSTMDPVPWDNRLIEEISIEYRFPTFICCYTAGNLELFKQYDVVITDPMALSRRQVKELQALGIKVINYVSFGEEDGTLVNIWDMNSGQGPHKGDGTGPGGYAGYYLKGQYGMGEQSECKHDRQRFEGVKACAQANSHYYMSVGRCSKACSKDWRTGFNDWEQGGKCGGGYTRDNKWIREAAIACSNETCPKYTPLHTGCPQYEQTENAWGQDFTVMTTNYPDENGIWKSFYVDAVKRGPGSWFNRLKDYYLPLVFDEPQAYVTQMTVVSATKDDGTVVLGFILPNAPIDDEEVFIVRDTLTGQNYVSGSHFSYDIKTGVVIMADLTPPVGGEIDPTLPPNPTVGQQITVNYSKRGLGSDGVFMDTVDTVDIYPDEIYQQGAADLINDLKLLYPNRTFCSNRGFSIYDRMMHSCEWIMTESVFSEYDFVNSSGYHLVDGDNLEWNYSVAEMIQGLREKYNFDVVCLNYADNGPLGDPIREAVFNKTLDLGWMPWLSTILLNDPLPNNPFTRDHGFIRSTDWRKIDVRNI